jgi:hypothetical protein
MMIGRRGTAKIHPYKQKEVFKWAKKIVERYMGKRNAEAYGRRNSEEGLVLVRIKPTRILAEKHSCLGVKLIIISYKFFDICCYLNLLQILLW